MIATIRWMNLNSMRIAELKKMRKEYDDIVDSQEEEQQQITRYQIGTINILLAREGVQITEEPEQVAEAPVIDYDEHQPPLVSNTGSINNYKKTNDPLLNRLKKKKRNGCLGLWN